MGRGQAGQGSGVDMDMAISAKDRFYSKVEVRGPDECWEWLGGRNSEGYGRFSMWPKMQRAHRVSYVISKGQIPSHLVLDHLCRNRGCVNPAHLEAVTHAENIRRCPPQKRCIRGHEFTDANTRYSGGKRKCKECERQRDAVRRSRQKGEMS